MNSLSFAIGINIGAEGMAGGPLPRVIVCICLDCYHRVDPKNDHAVHPVPSTIAGECAWCPCRDQFDLRFVALPRELVTPPTGGTTQALADRGEEGGGR